MPITEIRPAPQTKPRFRLPRGAVPAVLILALVLLCAGAAVGLEGSLFFPLLSLWADCLLVCLVLAAVRRAGVQFQLFHGAILVGVYLVLAICGVAKLSLDGTELKLDPAGVGIVLLSAVGYASYIIAVNKSRVRDMHSRKLAFYVFVFTALIFGVKNWMEDGVLPLPDAVSAVNVVLLAVAPTVISNITLLLAVRNIGGTLTSILGALEPVTAVCIGALVFGEAFTASEAVGIALILTAVVLVILNRSIKENISVVLKRIRPRHS